MKFKQRVAVLVAAVLAFLSSGSLANEHSLPVAPVVPTENNISKEDAVALAKNEMLLREELALDSFENYRIKACAVLLETGEEAWVVMLDEQAYGTDALVTIDAIDAAILDYQATDTEIISAVVNQWTERKGAMSTWSVEDQALYDWLFGASDDYIVPTEDHISKEEAGMIALSAIEQTMTSVELGYTFKLFSYTDGRPDQYVWLVTVMQNGKAIFVVHVSAVDGTVLEVFRTSNFG